MVPPLESQTLCSGLSIFVLFQSYSWNIQKPDHSNSIWLMFWIQTGIVQYLNGYCTCIKIYSLQELIIETETFFIVKHFWTLWW